jgi:hypothetical protein
MARRFDQFPSRVLISKWQFRDKLFKNYCYCALELEGGTLHTPPKATAQPAALALQNLKPGQSRSQAVTLAWPTA